MKQFISIFVFVLTVQFSQSQSIQNLPIPEELLINISNHPLLEAKHDKSFIPYEQLIYVPYTYPEVEAIEQTLHNYVIGTSTGKPHLIKKAFHDDLNLYSIGEDGSLRALSGKQYIGYFKEGERNDRIGKIVSIDVVNNVAMAKVEINSPSNKTKYTDYMMLLKVKGAWTIVHKSFTWEAY